MSIKKWVTALIVGCVLSFGTTEISLAQSNKTTKQQVKKPQVKKPQPRKNVRKQANRKKPVAVNRKKNNRRVKAVLGSGAVAAAGTRQNRNRSLIYSVMDLNTGEYLERSNESKVHSLASLTKLMSSYVFMNNHPNWKDCEITISEKERDTLKYTRTRLSRKDPHSCEKILEAVLVMSDNWAAHSLANNVPGMSKGEFIRKMNKQARMWGMKDTVFADSSGVSPNNKSTAKDLNILISQLSKDGRMQEISTKRDVVVRGTNGALRTFHNTNMLVRENFFGSHLSKTGFINESGYNLVFVPQFCANGRHLSLVVMGARSSMTRASFARQILNKYECV